MGEGEKNKVYRVTFEKQGFLILAVSEADAKNQARELRLQQTPGMFVTFSGTLGQQRTGD